MKIKIKKSVLKSFKEKLKENKSSRGDKIFNKTQGFYGNQGSVKSFNVFDEDSEELPVSPGAHMSMQLSIEEPPVDDPDYVPGTHKELALAISRIAKEVPFNKIEQFYRKSHNFLDDVLDEQDVDLFNEAINYEDIHPMHQDAIKNLIKQYAGSNTDSQNQEYANLIASNRNIKRYNISVTDILEELEKIAAELQPPEESQPAEEPQSTEDILVNPPGDLEDLSPPKEKRKIATGIVVGADDAKPKKKKVNRSSSSNRRKDIAPPTDDELDKRAEDEIMDIMASAYSEFVEMDDYAKTWDWTDYKKEAPYLKVIFDITKILHELSYRVLQANYINKYGGYIYDPEADVGGRQKGGFVLEKQGPTSRPVAQAMIKRINADFGLNYSNMMRQSNILSMSLQDLTDVIERAMIGIFQRVPQLYQEFLTASQTHKQKYNIEGSVDDIATEAIGFFANVLAHKYNGESQKLDRDLINVAITGIFKRCLLELPTEIGVTPTVAISLDSLGKKKGKTDKTYGFNLAAAAKRFEKLRKDPKIAKQFLKLLPSLILEKILDSKTANVTKAGSKYNFEDKLTGLGFEIKASELKSKIKQYVKDRVEGKQLSLEAEEIETETDLEDDVYDPEQEEKDAKARLDKSDYEVRKAVDEMEKMISSGDWMHIAPLFGFSGAPGVRSWFLRYPQRKFMIMTAARSPEGPIGAKRYLEVFREMRENLGNSLITLNQSTPGVLDLMIDELTSKTSLSTSDQQMIQLLEEMRKNIEDLLNFYDQFESYEQAESENPEELKRLSNTPGGSLLRFGIGAVFDNIIKDLEKEWHAEMKAYLESKNGLSANDADKLAYYFTGLKNKPSKGDFNEDREKLSNAAKAFVDVGMEATEFFKALRYSQKWFFSTLDIELEKGIEGDNYYNMVRRLTSQPLYVKDKRGNIKLDKKVYKIFKNLIEGKNGAIAAYLDQLSIEQFQQETKEKIEKIKSEKPDVFAESLENIIKRYM
jgi:hypothetical protein